MIDWNDRLKDGRPPLRPGEFALLVGWSRETIRKLVASGAIPSFALVDGGERKIPVAHARETYERMKATA